MRLLEKFGLLILAGMILIIVILSKSCSDYRDKYYKSEAKLDEYTRIADSLINLPPDTIKLPPKIIKVDTVIYTEREYEEIENKPISAPKIYRDSLVNDSIDLHYQIIAQKLYSVRFAYKPIYKYQEKLIHHNIPYPVKIIQTEEINSNGLFFNVGLGYSDQFTSKVGLMYLTKKQNIFGYDFIRYGNQNIHMVSYGIKL